MSKFIDTFTNKIFKQSIIKTVSNYCGSIFQITRLGSLTGTDNIYLKPGSEHESYVEEPYIYGCVWLISNTIASIPLQIYTDKSKETKENSNCFRCSWCWSN